MPEQNPSQDITVTVGDDAHLKAIAVGNDNQIVNEATATNIVQAQNSTVTIVGGHQIDIQVYSLSVGEQNKVDWAAYRKELRKESAQPYKFLQYYETTDADRFFGRDAICDHIISKLMPYKAVLINGKSGSGKTSLVNAGLIPRLMNKGYLNFVFRDYGYPTDLIKQALRGEPALNISVEDCPDLASVIRRAAAQIQRPIAIFLDQFERFFLNLPDAERARFIEEIKTCFTAFSGEQIDLVFSMREDFYGRIGEFWERFPEFDADSYKVYLKPLSPAEAREAIIKPLKGLPVRYAPNFVDDVLVPDLMGQTSGGHQIEPPHLQIVCNRLYDAARTHYANALNDGELVAIDENLYTALDQVRGILQTYLDDVVTQAAGGDPARIALIRSMLKLMIQTSGTRKFVSLPELTTGIPDVPASDIARLTRKLQDDRVIEPRGQEQQASYSLSHEFMVAKVQSWYDEREMERKKAQETLERGLAEWKSSQALLNEKQVAHIRLRLGAEGLSAEAEQLLQASQTEYERTAREKAEREQKLRDEEDARRKAEQEYAEEQRKRADDAEKHASVQARSVSRIKKLVVGLVVLLLIAVGTAGVAWLKQKEAEEATKDANHRARVSRAQSLAAQAQSVLEQYPQRGLLLAVEALNTTLTVGEPRILEAEQALRDALGDMTVSSQATIPIEFSPDRFTPYPFTFESDAIAISPDSHWLIAGDWLWDLTVIDPNAKLLKIAQKYNHATKATFSPDSRWIVTFSSGYLARIWNLMVPDPTATNPVLEWSAEEISSMQFSPDSRWLLLQNKAKAAWLWDVTALVSQPEPFVLGENEEKVTAVAFSPDSHWLVFGNENGIIRLWDLTDSDPMLEPITLSGHKEQITDVTFSPDSRWLMTCSREKIAHLWDLTKSDFMTKPLVLSDTNRISYGDFSPNSQWLTTRGCAKDNPNCTVDLWDLTIPDPLTKPFFSGGYNSGFSIMFSPDSHWIITSAGPNRAHLWSLTTSNLSVQSFRLYGHAAGIRVLATSPDSHWLLTGGITQILEERANILWDLTAANPTEKPFIFPVSGDGIDTGIFSPDSRWLITNGLNMDIGIWDLNASNPVVAPVILRNQAVTRITYLSISPNGHWLIVGHEDSTIQLWPLRQEELINRACRAAGRNFSESEWDLYFREEEYRRTCPDLSIDPGIVMKAQYLARGGDINGSIAMFQRMKELDPRLSFNPQAEAHKYAAEGLIDHGDSLARAGNLEDAIDTLKKARQLDPGLNFDPETKVKEFAAPGFINRGEDLAKQGNITEALAAYEQAQTFDPKLNISADSWNILCRKGSLWGYAAQVISACEKAVTLAPGSAQIRDSRGLTHALTGNFTGAIDDFQAFVDATDNEEEKAQHQQWIEALRKGENPFTPEVLEGLK